MGFSFWRASPLFSPFFFCFAFCNETRFDAFVSRWQCPAEALPLPQGIPLKSMIQRLKKKVRYLTKGTKEMEGELRRLRESHSEATAEATYFRNLHVKGIIKYSRRKANFEKELEEHKKHASDRSWAQAAKISSLRVELSAAQERISQLAGSSSRPSTLADSDRE